MHYSTPADQQHMLDITAEQNIGNGTVLKPQPGGATVIPQANPERVLMLSGPSSARQTTSARPVLFPLTPTDPFLRGAVGATFLSRRWAAPSAIRPVAPSRLPTIGVRKCRLPI